MDPKRTAGSAWAIVLGFSTLVGLICGWRIGVGIVAAMVLYGGLIQMSQELKVK